MNWQNNPYTLPLVLSGAAAALVALLAWRRRPAPGARSLALMLFSTAIWALAYGGL